MTMDIGNLRAKDIMSGQEMTVSVGGDFTIRTKIACWLIRVAGAVLTVPVKITIAPKPFIPTREEDFIA